MEKHSIEYWQYLLRKNKKSILGDIFKMSPKILPLPPTLMILGRV